MLKIRLCDYNNLMLEAWSKEFSHYDGVEILSGSIFDHPAHAIVSPGNSFGFMDAGIDKAMADYFKFEIEKVLRETIADNYAGELPVGNALILKTDDDKFSNFIYSPTMRVPMRLPKDSVNVYLAARASFAAIKKYNQDVIPGGTIDSVIIPGMGVGHGNMPFHVAAKQMRFAYEGMITGTKDYPTNWKRAVEDHRDMLK